MKIAAADGITTRAAGIRPDMAYRLLDAGWISYSGAVLDPENAVRLTDAGRAALEEN